MSAAEVEPGAELEPRRRRSPEHWALLVLALLGVAALVVLGVFVAPDPRGHGTHERFGLPPCLPMALWGVPCPGCGVTTAMTHAAHGELGAALATQPFGLLVFLALPLVAAWASWTHLRGGDLGERLRDLALGRWLLLALALMLAAWIYKLAITLA